MPIPARLSSRLHQVLEEDVAEQLIDWLNDVESEYARRATFRMETALRLRSSSRRTLHRPYSTEACWSAERSVVREFVGFRVALDRFRADMIFGMFVYSSATILGTLVLLITLG